MTVDTDEEILGQLADEPIEVLGFLTEASNHTLLVRVGEEAAGLHAIYKPRAGERPLWDFPTGTLCQREAAAFAVSDFLGWDVVPPTILREGPMGDGSLQLFVPHDPSRHYFVLIDDVDNHSALARMAVFDLLVNNADRKGSHVVLGRDGHLWGVDHGLTFHVQTKLRTVIWEFGGVALEGEWRADLARLLAALGRSEEPLTLRLAELLAPAEVTALELRAAALVEARSLPAIEESRRPYPWPPL